MSTSTPQPQGMNLHEVVKSWIQITQARDTLDKYQDSRKRAKVFLQLWYRTIIKSEWLVGDTITGYFVHELLDVFVRETSVLFDHTEENVDAIKRLGAGKYYYIWERPLG